MLDAVFDDIPQIYKFCYLAYSQASILRYGSHNIFSEEGTQQGDPLSPLLFCITLQPLLSSLSSELVIGYIDDVTLGGTVSAVQRDVDYIKEHGTTLGCDLNITKCELISHSSLQLSTSTLNSFIKIIPNEANLLGAPLFSGSCLDFTLNNKLEEMTRLSDNLRHISAHDALLILKYSLSTPRILHLLRCSPCHNHQTIADIDNLLRTNICHIANVDLSASQWMQASLPTKSGGLGIRRGASLALPAFLFRVKHCVLTRSYPTSYSWII